MMKLPSASKKRTTESNESMIEQPIYLPLFREDGDWIERPDLMVLAFLSEGTEVDRQHAYLAMVAEERLNPNETACGMSRLAKHVEEKIIRRNTTQRVLAGQVVLELARLAASTGKPPTLNAARRLVNYKHSSYIGKLASEQNRLREVERSFSDYKAIVHLLATAAYDPQLLVSIEGDEEGLLKFLGIARAFEEFIDANVVSRTFKWTPWRVPTRIKSLPEINFLPLSNQELAAAISP